MPAHTIGARIVLDGEKQYREAIKNINAAQKELRSEMKLASSQFAGQQNSIDALTKKHEILGKQVEQQKQKMEVYARAVETSSKEQAAAVQKVEQYADELEKAQKAMEEMSSSGTATKEELEAQQKTIDKISSNLKIAQSEYNAAERSTLSWKSALNNAEAEMNSMNSEMSKLEGYMDEAEHSTDKCAKSIDGYGESVKEASEGTSRMGDVMMGTLASQVILQSVKALAGAIKEIASASIETGMQFEASMSNVQALSGAAGDELDALTEKAKEMGASTMFSASQAADALSYMALAGWNTGDMLEGIEPILSLAAAANMDLAQASDIVTDYLTAFGLSAKDAAKFSDQMAYAMANSNTTVELLGESYKNCAATAASLGYSVEDVTAVLMTMANAGVKGGEAGTGLSTIMTRLATNAKECSDALAEYGVYVYDTEGKMNSLSSILEGMGSIWADLTDQEQASLAKTIAGTQQYSKLQTIMQGVSEAAQEGGMSFYDYSAALAECDGSAKKMADTMQNNLRGKLTILESSMDALKESTYEVFSEDLTREVESATNAVSRLNDEVKNGNLGVSFRNMSKSMAEFVDHAVELGEKALPTVIDGATFVIDHGGEIASMITAIVAEMIAMKVAAVGLAAVLSSIAPIGAAVVAGLAIYSVATYDATAAMDEATRAMRDEVEANNRLLDSISSGAEERKQSREDIEREAQVVSSLRDELIGLNDKQKLTTEEQARMRAIIDQLNEALPDLNLDVDKYGKLTAESTKALNENVEAMLKQHKVAAASEDLSRIASDQYEAEKKLLELEKQIADQKETTAKAEERYRQELDNAAETMGDYQIVVDQVEASYNNALQTQQELEEQYEQTRQSIADLSDEYETTQKYIEDNTEAVEDNADAVKEAQEVTVMFGDSMVTVRTESEETAHQLSELGEAYLTAKSDAEASLNSQIGLFEELDTKSDLTVTQMADRLHSQAEAISTYNDDMNVLRSSSNEGVQEILENLSGLGIEGAGYVHELANALKDAPESVEEVVKAFKEVEQAKEKLAGTMADIQTGYSSAMGNILGEQGDKIGDFNAANQKWADEAVETVADMGARSVEVTETSLANMDTAVQEGGEQLHTSVDEMCTTVIDGTHSALGYDGVQSSVFRDIGESIPKSMAAGIEAGTSVFVSAVTTMIDRAVNEAIERAKKAAKSIDKALGGAMK